MIFDRKWLFGIGGALLLFGASLETIKFFKPTSKSPNNLELSKLTFEPYSRKAISVGNAKIQQFESQLRKKKSKIKIPSEADRAQTAQAPNLFAENTPQTHDFVHSKKISDPKKKKKATDDLEFYIDKNGNLVAKKKVKTPKKKKKEASSEDLLAKKKKSENKQNDDKSKGTDGEDLAGSGAYQQPTAVVAPYRPPTEDATGLPLDEWRHLLLNQPDYKATTEFVKAYYAGQVKESDYYALAKMMVEDPRSEIKENGLYVLGAVKGTASFNLTVSLIVSEGGQTPLAKRADKQLQTYAQIQSLGIISNLIAQAGTNRNSLVFAVRLANEAAAANLQPKKGNSTGPSAQAASVSPQTVQVFSSISTNLTNLLNNSDASLKSEIELALGTIKKYLPKNGDVKLANAI